jgi:predicted RNase H-like HicB family nuclease
MIFNYPACFYPFSEDGGGYVVVVPDLPGCTTGGKTFKSALFMAEDAACGWILTSLQDGEKIPHPTPTSKIKADEYPDGFVIPLELNTEKFKKLNTGQIRRKTPRRRTAQLRMRNI